MAKGKLKEKIAAARGRVAGKPGKTDDAARDSGGISPDPRTNLILADIALRGGSALLRRGIERGLLGRKYTAGKAADIVKDRTMGQALVGTALARVATKSVPGAIVVGGGLLAKALFDWRKDKKAAKDAGEAASDAMTAGGAGRETRDS